MKRCEACGQSVPEYPKLGGLFRTYRQQAGLTQEELAGQMGLKRTSIVNFEAGRQDMPLKKVLKLASLLKIPKTKLAAVMLEATTSTEDE